MKSRLRSISNAVVAIALVAVVAMLLVFVMHFHRALFTSDEAVVNMLAQSMFDQGRVLPLRWVNNNGDLMIPSGAMIVAPLLYWISNGFAAHSIAGAFAVVVLPVSLTLLLRRLGLPIGAILLAATLIVSGFSYYATIFVFAQTTYVWWPAGFFLGAYLIHSWRHPECGMRAWPLPALFLLVFSISFANPGRVLLMMVIPLYAFDWVLRNQRHRVSALPQRWRLARRTGILDPLAAIGIGAAFLLALLAYIILKQAGITQSAYGAANLHWGGWPSVGEHAHTFARGWFSYFGGIHENNSSSAIHALLSAFRYCIPVGLGWVAIRELYGLTRQTDVARRALALAFATAFFPLLAMYLLLEPLAFQNKEPTMRYFTVAVDILVALGAFGVRDALRRFPRASACLASLAAIFLVAVSACRYLPVSRLGAADFWQVTASREERLGALLKEQGLVEGYAPYWTAGAVTVLSDSAVHAYPVEINRRGVAPNTFMISSDWYRPQRWSGATFLAVPREDVDSRKRAMIDAQLGAPSRELVSPDFYVYVYDRNIAAAFSCRADGEGNERIAKGTASARVAGVDLADAPSGVQPRLARVRVRNEGILSVDGTGRFPLSIGVRLLTRGGSLVNMDWIHAPLRCPLDPGQETLMSVALPDLPDGRWLLRFDILQEGVAWFEDRGVATIDIPIDTGTDASIRATQPTEPMPAEKP